jgi:peptide/nickel transport system permease protein
MVKFLVQRTLGMIVTMFFVSIMVFIIMELPPGDYAERWAFRKFSGTGDQITEADLDNIRANFGLDRPAHERYFSWISNIVLHGDFGQAFSFQTSVNNVIGEKIWLTLAILFSTLVVTYLVSIPGDRAPEPP